MLIDIFAKGYTWLNGWFKETLTLPQTPDSHPETREGGIRYKEQAIELYDGTSWVRLGITSLGYQLHSEGLVLADGTLEPGATTYTNEEFIGKFVDVYLNGSNLSTGLEDRQAYNYNILTGRINFNSALAEGDAWKFYTYMTSIGGSGITIAATYADVVQSGAPHFVQVIADETNEGATYLYYWTGSILLPIVGM